MKLEDPTETWDFFNKGAGESLVTQVESFQANAGSISNAYQDTKSARVEKRARIDLQDLKEQGVGEAHMFFKSRITRYRAFYAAPKGAKAMRLNQFLKIELPRDNELYALVKGIEDFEVLSKSAASRQLSSTLSSGISKILAFLEEETGATPIDKGLNSFIKYFNMQESGEIESKTVAEDSVSDSGVTIFDRLTVPDYLEGKIIKERFTGEALLSRKSLESSLNYLFRLMSLDDSESSTLTDDIIKDIANNTLYSPDSVGKLPEVKAVVNNIKRFNQEMPLDS